MIFSPRLSRGKRYFKKNGHVILATVGMITTVVAVVEAIKASPSAEEIRKQLKEDATPVEKVKAYAPIYAETFMFTGIAVGSMAFSTILSVKTIGALTAGYLALEKNFRSYRETMKSIVKGVNGPDGKMLTEEEFDQKILEIQAEDEAEKAAKEHPIPSDGEFLFYDENSKRFFTDTLLHVHDTEYALNRNFTLRGYCELNEFYELLDHAEMPPTEEGSTVGWNSYIGEISYGYTWVDFEHHEKELEDGTNYISIHTPFPPTADALI